MSKLRELSASGQSIWIDFIRRDLVTSGALQRLVRDDGLSGMTSNPAIFEQAIREGSEYREAVRDIVSHGIRDPERIYEQLAVTDVRLAADALREKFDTTEGRDGYVSLEVSPHLAHQTEATLREARRLWSAVARPNLMIKVPGTPAGFPAVEALIREGINVNVTLLFSPEACVRAADAYIAGLEQRAQQGKPVHHLASVASFFVSRIDSAVDPVLSEKASKTFDVERQAIDGLSGAVAVAWAKLANQRYKKAWAGPRWRDLAHAGARPQRLVWASTSTKNPRYSDVLYVEQLIGPGTINTVPPATIDAFRDHGRVAPTLDQRIEQADAIISSVERLGVSMREISQALLTDGVSKFVLPFDALMGTIAARRDEL